ncbi:sensor histidine kinase [Winogradskyella aurantia]|uniref:histidine kinase n=1 Tax=Winogradskyella aurantia TaxID=1915063 RepID=A0A265UUQ3_9FLAO|nr:ATP-binding protein [Winogradskyella aurantia]OZV69036.1 two-component sensor histidine kinase [Winogradskyella aurantia]
MNKDLQIIKDIIETSEQISKEDKDILLKALKKANTTLEISEFKLERTNKVKRTTAILLEETIEELEQKRAAIEKTNEALNKSLKDLKMAQAQLVQSEKMASLGELTAGIAHEIQNPLNFVNNFSEVSKELLEEMLEELKNGDMEEVNAIASDVIANLEKILHHGKRADGIVKGMLQHSRTNSGEKEFTDLNQLVDEYLRLAYHGLRAKDKSFNAALETHFDTSIGKLNIIPQDIGRVVLNLITNAFHACDDKKKLLSDKGNSDFQPTVSVTTKKIKQHIEISVADNGNGIPDKIVDKIFQPFFTTKPTGEGTGLGLSLSYDIIKSHGGVIKVNTKDKQGTTFIISIPVKSKA